MAEKKGGGGGVLLGIGALLLAPVAGVLGLALLVSSIGGAGTGASSGGQGLNPEGIPADYVPWILKAGAICPEVSPAFIAAHIEAESNFKDHPPNSMGAAGPAQFVPEAWAADGVDADGNGTKDLHSVPDAVMAMGYRDCRDWKKAAALFPNNTLDVVLSAYNHGPKSFEYPDGVCHCTETTKYIATIKASIAKYTAAGIVAGGPAPSASGVGAAIIAFAQTKLGGPYVWGGNGPVGYDCSGLVKAAYASVGITTERHTVRMYNQAQHIAPNQARPGDMVFFDTGGEGGDPSHVGIYLGNGQFLHAPNESDVIKVSSLTTGFWASANPRFTHLGNW